jgi:hypothetical protein
MRIIELIGKNPNVNCWVCYVGSENKLPHKIGLGAAINTFGNLSLKRHYLTGEYQSAWINHGLNEYSQLRFPN